MIQENRPENHTPKKSAYDRPSGWEPNMIYSFSTFPEFLVQGWDAGQNPLLCELVLLF